MPGLAYDPAQAKKLLAEAGYPNGLEVGFMRTQPIVEPGLIQTSDAIVADLAKAGIRVKARMVGESGPFTNLVRDSKPDPMFEWSWGYYSIFDADAIFYDVMTCNQPYSYYCNKAFDDLVFQGRSTLDTKKRAEIYAKAQRMIHDDAAYLFKWGCAECGASATASTTRPRATRSIGCGSVSYTHLTLPTICSV